MKSKIKAAICVVLMAVLLSGCSFVNLDPTSLMRPPRSLSGDIDGIQRAIESAMGTEIVYKYPRRGEYRYAIVQYDLDADNRLEAVAFFREKNDLNTTIIMILSQNDKGVWKPSALTKGAASDVDRLMFHDFDTDGISELIVGWSGYSANMNTASVYRYKPEGLTEVQTVKTSMIDSVEITKSVQPTYSEMVLCNLNGIGAKELVFIELNTGAKQAKAKIFEYAEDNESYDFNLNLIGEAPLDGNISGYRSCQVGRVSENVNAVVISGLTENELVRTELLMYDADTQSYFTPLSGKDYIAKYSRFPAMDINGDSLIEIPTDTVLPGYEQDGKEYLTSWNIYASHYSPSYLKPVVNAVHNIEDGYYLALDNSWIYDMTARISSINNTTYFHLVDRSSGSPEMFGAEVFRICVCDRSQWEKCEQLGFQILAESNGKAYCALIIQNTATNFEITYDDLINNFHLFS